MSFKKLLVTCAKAVFNALYRLFGLLGRRDEVLFVSRQSEKPSLDFLECGAEFQKRGCRPVYLARRLTRKTLVAYAFHTLKETYHLARCRVCVLDRYDPVVSLIRFDCEPSKEVDSARHREFPRVPVILQLWHAFGAFKKFGYQTINVSEGHSDQEAALFRIHRNYSWVICSGEGARDAFAEAFSYPRNRVLPLCRPEYRKLIEIRDVVAGSCNASLTSLLFVPTVRKYDKTAHPFRDLHGVRDHLFDSERYESLWAFHPLETGEEASLGVPPALLNAEDVITDYSSIVYEAYLLGKRAVFYIPDIDHYRRSPGLNSDPALLCPDLVAFSAQELVAKLDAWRHDPDSYPFDQFERFVEDSFEGASDDPALAIVEFALSTMSR